MAEDQYPDKVEIPDCLVEFYKGLERTCNASANTLNDHLRKIVGPLIEGVLEAIERAKTDTQLASQSNFQEYFKNEILPDLEKKFVEQMGSRLEEYGSGLKKLLAKTIGDYINRRFEKYTEKVLGPKLEEIRRYVDEKTNGKEPVEEPKEEKSEKELDTNSSLASMLDLDEEKK